MSISHKFLVIPSKAATQRVAVLLGNPSSFQVTAAIINSDLRAFSD